MVDDNSECKKAKGANRNVAVAVSHKEYKDAWLNNKCLRHSMKRIQSKDHRIGTLEMYENSLPNFRCIYIHIYIYIYIYIYIFQNNG